MIKKIQPDEIYNLAAQSHVRISFDLPGYTNQVNSQGFLRFFGFFSKMNMESPKVHRTRGCRENLDRYESKSKNSRKVMTLSLLRVIGNQIARTEWSNDSKLTVWGACTTAFFGALRFGEILPQKSNDYCEMETLLWNDLKFRSDGSVLMHIKLDKVRNMKGSFIDIFEFPLAGCCPVKTLNQMRETKFNSNRPVFQFKSGKNLCSAQLNIILQNLLCPIIGPAAYQISGHSFRAGLPSAMASKPDLANDKDIKAWGRWSSDSYLLYTRLKHKQKKALFEKIVSVLETKN